MPELPEVECTRRRIAPDVEGRRIIGFASLWPRKVFPSESELSRRVRGQKILPLRRHGKRLILPLADGSAVTVHLGMSGNLEFYPANVQPSFALRLRKEAKDRGWPRSLFRHRGQPQKNAKPKILLAKSARHLRAVFVLSRGALLFLDARKFGRIEWHPSLEQAYAGLGPDALDPALTAFAFGSALAKTRRPIKLALLDQALIAGVGNIYSDEALFRARIHPLTSASSLTPGQLARLFRAVRAVLRASICRQGTSIDWVWPGGRMQHHLLVYGRTGEPCVRCKAAIRHLVLGQRSCHFCARCQPTCT